MNILNDKIYNVLKWVAVLALPAFGTFYTFLAPVWGWPYSDEIGKTVLAVSTLIGTLIGVSTLQYNKLQNINHK